MGGCIYGSWYLLDTSTKKVHRADPRKPKRTCTREGEKNAAGKPGAKTKAVRVNPGTVLVQALPILNEKTGKVTQKTPQQLVRAQRRPGADGRRRHEPARRASTKAPAGTGAPNVTFGFTSHGKSVFERVTKEIAHRGQEAQLPGVGKEAALQHFAVVLDGQLITTPSIDYTKYPEGIDASTGSQISGGFTITSAQNLASELQSGALPIKLELISNSQVSATLGKTALNQGLIAGLVGFAIVCLFLLIFYRVLGVIAIGGLVIYGIYFFALIKLIPITLTLPGIAGYILTIGVAADANIVIFERVKEEIRGGRSVMSGIATGYKRGFAAIVDANVVTFMTAFILFALATAEVKGFAFTLGIGTLVSLFTAVLATQAALGTMGRSQTRLAPRGARRRAQPARLDVRLHGSVEVVLLAVGHDPADRRAGDRRQRPELRHRLQVRDAHPDGLREAGQREPSGRSDDGRRLRQRRGAEVHQQEHRRHRLSDLHEDAEAGQGPEDQGRSRREVRHGQRVRHQELLLHLDRADVRQNRRQQRDHRDHRLAAGDLGLHRAALRVEVRGPGADRADARPADHGRRVFADRAAK